MKREYYLKKLSLAFKTNPIVAILGPRQCGKTTLARMYAQDHEEVPDQNYFDLERASDSLRLADPEFVFGQLKGLVIIDEVQRKPELFDHLRVLTYQLHGAYSFYCI